MYNFPSASTNNVNSKFNIAPENKPIPKGKDHLPTIFFFSGYVKLRGVSLLRESLVLSPKKAALGLLLARQQFVAACRFGYFLRRSQQRLRLERVLSLGNFSKLVDGCGSMGEDQGS